MTDQRTRIALLVREGQAREQLEQALREAGAELVAQADPASGSVDEVIAAAPHAVLVALEPAIEDALDRWTQLLSDPGIAVIYDEAELAANRSGWDAARWIRHLRAKLNRHDDVLPPGAEPEEDWQPVPGPLPAQAREVSEEAFLSIEDEAQENADAVPADEGLEAWLEKLSGDAEAEADDADPDAQAGVDAALPGLSVPDVSAGAVVDAVPAPENSVPEIADAAAEPDATAPGIEALEERIAGLSLVDVDSYGHGPERGAVVVEAGLGGPDAVRQLLAGLEIGFPRPLLVRLRLDGGRYDRLVRQMGRATPLTATLAEEDATIEPGHVYFLPPGLDVARDKGRLRFIQDGAAAQKLPGALPADDSAVLFLSGGDPALVDEAMSRAGAGALVFGQSPEDNFDPAATTRLLERGGNAATPAQIAAELLERWPPTGRPAGADLEDPDQ